MRFSLQAPAGLDAVEVAVDIDLEQGTRVISRPPTRGTIGGLKAQFAQIEGFDEGIDHPHWVVVVDVVLQPIREQKPLGTINSIDKSLHAEHQSTGAEILPAEGEFSHSLGRKQPLNYWLIPIAPLSDWPTSLRSVEIFPSGSAL